ncbi:MAG: arsenate reductase ArsC [Coriobacteriia bacterium]|nr:arsenate reductase ArsC [Coriobacteriia bacterium]
MHLPRVLFLCTGNTARSQMAEAILRQRSGDSFEVHSAGLEPSEVRSETIAVLKEAGISTEGLRSKGVDEYLGKMHINYLVTVCAHAEESCPRIWPVGGHRLFWSISDPAVVYGSDDERLAAFRRARDEIARLIDEWLESQPGSD